MAGGFDQGYSGNSEAISEHFVYTEHGAIAVIMNARYGWYSPGTTHGPSQYFDYEFFDAIYTENIKNLGAANDDSKTDNAGAAMSDAYLRWCYLELNLHGDPHTEILEPVKYDHDIAVSGFQSPDFMDPGTTAVIEALIRNRGLNDESDIEIEFLVDDAVEEIKIIDYLASGQSQQVSFDWTPTEYLKEYKVGIHAVPVPDENVTTNNLQENNVMVEYTPVADAGQDKDAFSGQEVTLDGSNSYDLDDGIAEWNWNFGDGTTGSGEIVTHTYASIGSYHVSLTVKDHYGAEDTDTCIVTVWEGGHDMQITSLRTPNSARLGTTKDIIVKIKNVGTYEEVPMGSLPDRYGDYVLVTLYITKPDGTKTTQTTQILIYMGGSKTLKFSVTFDQVGEWSFSVHVDICDKNGSINPFPYKDQNPADNDMTPDRNTRVR
jgi:hypothetical protein